MVLAGLVMSGMLTACDGVMSKGDSKAVTGDPAGWQKITMPVASKWDAVTYGAGKFVAVSVYDARTDSAIAMYSTDGINWTTTTELPGTFRLARVTYGAGKFVVVSSTGVGAYSTDGINWMTTTLPSGN
jgi:hypothetical protein